MMNRSRLTVALPKGRLGEEVLSFLEEAGLPVAGVDPNARTLLFDFPAEGVTYLICKPTDVPTFVEYGVADLGVAGKDTLEESGADLFELADLGFGRCHFAVAVTRALADRYGEGEPFPLQEFAHHRVATKFPRVAGEYFRSLGMQMEIIRLHGNVELAACIGLSDMIVDIVSTGRTLRENDLVEVARIFEATARLVANRVSYRLKNAQIAALVRRLERVPEQETGNGGRQDG